MVNTAVNLCGITLANPIIPASGTFGFGQDFADLYDLNLLGTFSFKGTTLNPGRATPAPDCGDAHGHAQRRGPAKPRVHRVIAEELPRIASYFSKPVMANVSGFALSEYVEVCALLSERPRWAGWR